MIEIGSRNNAPTPQHQTQDIYSFTSTFPARPDKPFCFEQSIGGGHCEQGGAVSENAKPVGRWQVIAGWFKRNIHFSGRYGV
ncbi:hypothetical protein [Pseudomonas sp. PDM09]|uniref:hypothetical protein n=1 Tax=Pseudomonas sp. PDM09 TaxID=2769270 RepID=UPI001785F941|nr:hypothetical protein [Pseudomonas sp. PDM09]MBD9562707.1 hypothetical protein [Pseudomonas sp. PDM09]